MSSFGPLPAGFVEKTNEDILEEIGDDEKGAFGPAINVEADSVLGQINGIFGDQIAQLWEVALATYRSAQPDSASGEALDNVAAITGALRLAPLQSTVTWDQILLTAGTTLPLGSVASVGSSGPRFETLAAVTNSAIYQDLVSVEAQSEDFGPIVGNAKSIDTIQTPVAGWTAQAASKNANAETYVLVNLQTLLVKVDGGAAQTVTFLTADFAAIGAALAAEVAARISTDLAGASAIDAGGQVLIISDLDGAGSAIEITGGTANAVLGFLVDEKAGLNSTDAVAGRNLETDVDFRIRREQLIRATGKATIEAIRSAVLGVENVTEVFVFENTALLTDADGVPGKSFEVVVLGGVDADIADAIFDAKPAGILAFGSTIVAVADSQSISHDIGFSRPTMTQIFIEADLTTDPAIFGGGDVDAGKVLVQNALKALGDSLGIGDDIIALTFQCAPTDVSGVIDVPALRIEDIVSPTNEANIVSSNRELFTFDTADIVVTVI